MRTKWLLHNFLADNWHSIGNRFACLGNDEVFSDIIAILCADFQWVKKT
jgi:hypothetical protein